MELSGGCSTSESGFALFTVDVEATPEGMNHIDEIVGVVYQYVRMLREAGPSVSLIAAAVLACCDCLSCDLHLCVCVLCSDR